MRPVIFHFREHNTNFPQHRTSLNLADSIVLTFSGDVRLLAGVQVLLFVSLERYLFTLKQRMEPVVITVSVVKVPAAATV